jgi:hypothetical protein
MRLIDVFDEYPKYDELIWNFMGTLDFENQEFSVLTRPIDEVITPDLLEQYNLYATKPQKTYVKSLMKNIDRIKKKPIIVSGKTIVDGNHKLLAMYLSGIKFVNIIEV